MREKIMPPAHEAFGDYVEKHKETWRNLNH